MYTDLLSEGHHHDYGYLILSGGKNRRMEGQVKLFMKVLGKSQLQRLQELIQHTESLLKEAGLSEKNSDSSFHESAVHKNAVHEKKNAPLWISIGADSLAKEDQERYLSTGLPLVPDLYRDCGPMGGILSGLTPGRCFPASKNPWRQEGWGLCPGSGPWQRRAGHCFCLLQKPAGII